VTSSVFLESPLAGLDAGLLHHPLVALILFFVLLALFVLAAVILVRLLWRGLARITSST
jgi:hypothetical protein